jgi:hypothetical protein
MYWQCYLFAALQAAGIDQRFDLSTITILDKRWHFGERKWDFSPGRIKYRVQQALKGLSYLVMIEFEVFRNVRCLQPLPRNKVKLFRDQGRLIAPHVQGLTSTRSDLATELISRTASLSRLLARADPRQP